MSRGLTAGMMMALSLARAGAQSRRELEARVAPLAAQANAASRALTAYQDSVGASDEKLTRVELGPIHVVTTMALRPVVMDAMAVARHDLEVGLGTAVYRVVPMRFVVRSVWMGSTQLAGAVMVSTLASNGTEDWGSQHENTAADIATGIEHDAVSEISRGTGGFFWSWLLGQLPLKRLTAADWARARLWLVSDIREPAQACYAGDAGACKRALFPDLSPLSGGWSRPGTATLVVGLRPTLVAQALEMGGSGAMERLLSSSAGPAERIAAAANAPVDAVVSAWANQIRTVRVASPVMSASVTATSLLLMLACVGAALRSPRWR